MSTEHWQKDRRRRIGRYAPVLLWVCLIAYLSSSEGSSSSTSRFLVPLLEYLFPSATVESIAFYHSLIRKSAHLFLYGGFALVLMRAFTTSQRKTLNTSPWFYTFGAAALVAMADEINQSINPLRTGTATDVLIDLTGVVSALAFTLILSRLKKR